MEYVSKACGCGKRLGILKCYLIYYLTSKVQPLVSLMIPYCMPVSVS